MFNFTKKQQSVLGDIVIATGIFVLAFLLKDAGLEEQNSGMLTVAIALIIRFGGLKVMGCNRKSDCK